MCGRIERTARLREEGGGEEGWGENLCLRVRSSPTASRTISGLRGPVGFLSSVTCAPRSLYGLGYHEGVDHDGGSSRHGLSPP